MKLARKCCVIVKGVETLFDVGTEITPEMVGGQAMYDTLKKDQYDVDLYAPLAMGLYEDEVSIAQALTGEKPVKEVKQKEPELKEEKQEVTPVETEPKKTLGKKAQ